MKKTATICILGLFLICLTASPALNLNAQDKETKKSDSKALKLLEEMIKAQGGRKTLEKIKDSTVIGSMVLTQMGMEGTVTLYQKEPNMMRLDIEVMGMTITQAYDGETAWFINPQTGMTEEMPEQQAEDIKRQALGYDSFLAPEKHGITYTYKGTEKIDEKDCNVLVQTHADGWEATMWVDAGTNLTYKTKAKTINQMGVEVEAETITTDYQEVNGVMVSHAMTTLQDGEEFMAFTLTEVNFNNGLEDSFFKMEE
jgi:outer membrane lipoprotein-sorting protein